MSRATAVHAFGDDALGELDAVGVARAIRTGAISAAEATAAALARAEAVDPTLNAIVDGPIPYTGTTSTRGVFAGVPTFVKDNNILAGFPTRQGSEIVASSPARTDGPVPSRLRDMGLTLLGKTAMPEFGLNGSTEHMTGPPTRNPWGTQYTAGGSSGGAAALVAAGVVPLAHGNDGGGSIRIPASCCGLVGLKPTRGRFVLATTERMLPVAIVSEGVLTRSVRDTAHFWAVADGWSSPRLPPIGLVEHPGERRLRIGVIRQSLGDRPIDDATDRALTDAAALLDRAGHHVEETEATVDPRFADDFLVYWSMLAFALQRISPRRDGRSRDEFDTVTTGLAARFGRNPLSSAQVIRRLRRTRADYARMFERFDVVVSPVVSHATPELGYLSPHVPAEELLGRLEKWVAFTPVHNTSGAPSLSFPLSTDSRGMPMGVMFSAAHGNERVLLSLAFELEEARVPAKIHRPRRGPTAAELA